jgi:hypothetical protein
MKGMHFKSEIAQFPLGDLAFKVQYSNFSYSSVLVKELARQVHVLSDTGRAILTPVLICPISSSMPQLSSCASNRSIQNRLSASWCNPSRIEKNDS